MLKIIKYSFFDMLRSKWTIIYFLFFLVVTQGLLYITDDQSKAIVGLLNIVVILCPLIATLFGTVNFYNSREFIELLLAQPIKRKNIFLGHYTGMTTSLALGALFGILSPFIIYGFSYYVNYPLLLLLLSISIFLTFIFTALSYLISIKTDNKMKGLGMSIILWLFLALVYDGLQLMILTMLENYPLEKIGLVMTFLNPIDLGRVMFMLKLDMSALLGYTGAVFNKFFGTSMGIILSFLSLSLWFIIPVFFINKISKKKDF